MNRGLLMLIAGSAIAGGLYATGFLTMPSAKPVAGAKPQAHEVIAPAVTVVRIASQDFRETALVAGTLVARDEILVGPEIEGLRVLEVLVEEGDTVKKGQPLARLVSDTLEAQVAQNTASQQRAAAAIAQARSTIAQAEARLKEAGNALERGKPLKQSGYLSESTLDSREAAARTATAQLAAARDGLTLAEAELAQIRAQRRELDWRRSKTDVGAPADGIVSRRNARVGAAASAVAEPMFRIIAKGEIELDGEVTETRIGRMKPGQTATLEVAGAQVAKGVVRLVSPEVDKATRLGRIRILLGANPELRIGSFARAEVATGESRGLAVPAGAVQYIAGVPHALVVVGDKVAARRLTLGLGSGDQVEVREGLAEGDLVVAKAGTFLREGDIVKPVLAATKVSGVN